MIRCQRCGASLDPTVLACSYCHLTTPAGIAARQRDAQAAEAHQAHAAWNAAAQFQAHEAERRRIGGIATQSLIWSIAGIVLCCLPLGVVGIIQGLRARSASVARALPVPGNAKIGLWLGIASCITSVGVLTWGSISVANDEARAKTRVAALEKAVGTKAESETLDRSTACQLAEVRALQHGWDGVYGYSLEGFDCPGRLTQATDAAELEDFRFHKHSERQERRVYVCFKRGTRWYVDDLSAAPCALPRAPGSERAPALPSSAPTGSTSVPARKR